MNAVTAHSDPLRLVLELTPGTEPVRGAVTHPDGEVRSYVGWVALISALDEMRRAHELAIETTPAPPRAGGASAEPRS